MDATELALAKWVDLWHNWPEGEPCPDLNGPDRERSFAGPSSTGFDDYGSLGGYTLGGLL